MLGCRAEVIERNVIKESEHTITEKIKRKNKKVEKKINK